MLMVEHTGLRMNSELNPLLWDGNRLKRDVRVSLLNFAEAWRDFADISEESVSDVLMVGGNASFFYNDHSDIDVHLVVEREKLGLGRYAEEYLKDKKALWSARHDVRVKGYQVEPYAQDRSERFSAGQGVYSLKRDEWVQFPVKTDYDPDADSALASRVSDWQARIDKMLELNAEPEEFDVLKNKLATMRSSAIRRGGELARDNLVFKALRLSGHLDRMREHVTNKKTERLTLR